jgi:hypothetical protein
MRGALPGPAGLRGFAEPVVEAKGVRWFLACRMRAAAAALALDELLATVGLEPVIPALFETNSFDGSSAPSERLAVSVIKPRVLAKRKRTAIPQEL